jgi:cytosine/adenosine deaminase-related metal-dependent hydrolase
MNAMSAVDVEHDSFLACSDLISVGVTGVQFIFHTFGPSQQYIETLEKSLNGIRRSGIRARVILAIADQYEFFPANVRNPVNLPNFVQTGPRMKPVDFLELIENAQKRNTDFDFGVGPVAPQWCSDAMMEAIGSIAKKGLRVHTHCLESEKQRHWISESPIDRLQRFGLLGQSTSLAHAIWLNDKELDLIKETGTHLVTCPRSNLFLNSGKANCTKWLDSEISFGVGLDSIGYRESVLETAKLSLSERDATYALITGGVNATGLSSDLDQVLWRDWENGIVEEVFINGKQIISNGKHINSQEIAESRELVLSQVKSDLKAREQRHKALDEVMDQYLALLKS